MTSYDPADSAQPDDLTRVSREVASRLENLGIELDGRETPDQLTRIEEAVEQFEEAVEARGGDLMMDEAPPGHESQPDDPHFALPLRHARETVATYLERLARATDTVRRHAR
jgi:hypothetical protein